MFFRAARAITRKTIIIKLGIILIIMIIMIIMLAILIQSPYYPDLLPCGGSASTEKTLHYSPSDCAIMLLMTCLQYLS